MTSAFADPPITPKAAATRARLLDIAAVVFIEHGYAAVSLRDIAKVAGVTKGAIYGHFRSKGQLLVEVIRTQLAERDARFDMDAAAEQPMTAFVQFINPDSRDLRLLQIDAAAAARHDLDVAAEAKSQHGAIDPHHHFDLGIPDQIVGSRHHPEVSGGQAKTQVLVVMCLGKCVDFGHHTVDGPGPVIRGENQYRHHGAVGIEQTGARFDRPGGLYQRGT